MVYGLEDYPRYYYLWHLIAIGALKANPAGDPERCPEIEQVIWDHQSLRNGRNDVKIALIDMGIARHHPNMESDNGADNQVIWNDALDLASHRYGAIHTANPQGHIEGRAQILQNITTNIPGISPEQEAILNEVGRGFGVERNVSAYSQRYATHGTACAGLVCGTSYQDQFGNQGNPVVYYGVDPHSKIVPITTSISPDPRQLIAAFLFALFLDVDVILFPRDAEHPHHTPGRTDLDADETTRLDKAELEWDLLTKVIEYVSEHIPIVCAAGNEGRSELIYPANLAADADNGVIAVGAVSYGGYRSGYSNYGDGLTVVAPSDDGEVYNRHQMRLDMRSPDILDFWVDNVHSPPAGIPEIAFSAERLITLDVPGPHGYVSGSLEGVVASRQRALDDPGGLYTEFGGTSGAAALVAGVVALMQRQSSAKVAGPEIKAALRAATPKFDISHWYWIGGGRTTLVTDAINGEPMPSDRDVFGEGGLVNAARLLNIPW